MRGEWDVVVLGPHFSAALLARDLGDGGPDLERTVRVRAHLRPRHRRPRRARAAVPGRARGSARRRRRAGRGRASRRRRAPGRRCSPSASAATSCSTGRWPRPPAASRSSTCALPDQPLVYVNAAFERLAGFPRDERARAATAASCRAPTPTRPRSPGSARRSSAGRGVPGDGAQLPRSATATPWWNEIHLAPVRDAARPRRPVHRRPARRHRAGRGRAGPAARSATAAARTWPGSRSSPTPTR